MASAFLSDSRLLFSIHSLSSSSSSSSSSSCPLSCRRSASSILIGVPSSSPPPSSLFPHRQRNFRSSRFTTPLPLLLPLMTTSAYSFRCSALTANGSSSSGIFTVGDFMTRKEELHIVKPITTVDRALEMLVENRITGFPVVDDDWKLVGVVSDYDLLALDSISGSRQTETSMFPEVDSTWKTFNEIQKLLIKTNGKVVADVMTIAPLVVRETTNLEDAARLLLETKYRRLPVVDSFGKLVGIITRGNVVRAALQIKHENEKRAQV